MDVELDEVAFRSVAGRHYLASIWRRGSSKIWLAKLPYRITQTGQEGGGLISIDEMTVFFTLTNQFLEKARSATLTAPRPTRPWQALCTMDPCRIFRSSCRIHAWHTNHQLQSSQKEMSVPVWNGNDFREEIRMGGRNLTDFLQVFADWRSKATEQCWS